MADSQELDPKLSAEKAMYHRDAIVNTSIEYIAKSIMVNVDLDQYLQNQHLVARLATSEAVNDQELVDV